MSIEKKIMFGGWNSPESFPRKEVRTFLDADETRNRKFSLKRNRKQCKRNKNLPHEYVLTKEKVMKWGNGGVWRDYACRHCGKTEYVWKNQKDINIVG